MIRKRIIVKGTVQGVGYRFFARSLAGRYSIAGFVRNLPDGNVEAEAQGREDDMSMFIEGLRKGPPASYVTGLESEEMPIEGSLDRFEIRL